MEFLVPQEKYLEAGVHIGTKTKYGGMKKFIYKQRDDGLHVLDLKKMDERIKAAANLLSKYEEQRVFVVGSKENAAVPIKRFCEVTGFNPLVGRFTPGRFTNPSREDFCEPSIVLITDPASDRQALKEAYEVGIPSIAFCDTNNYVRNVDLIVPLNNKGKKSLALVFWLLGREILKKRGVLSSNDEYAYSLEEFEGTQ